MSNSGERDSRASAEALLKKAQKGEHQLRTILQSKGFSDGSAYALLTTLRGIYQEILLTDHAFAVEHDVEQALWRGIYRRIEDFRGRIRKYSQAAAGPSAPTGPPKPGGSKAGTPKEALQKALAGFRGFLGDATGFYHELVFKLRALYGLPQDFSPSVPDDVVARVPSEKLRLCQASCHRCLIYLGDLARYKELHSDNKTKDWAIVANYYLQAAALWPASGNPHNQLAVLATYVDDELLAVYRYYRSLAEEVPFITARDNLLMLFEKNRGKYTQLSTAPQPKSSEDPLSTIRNSFRTRFVRLNGIIFTKTSVETFSDVYAATMSNLDALLEADDVAMTSAGGTEQRSGMGVGNSGAASMLQVVVVAIFTVHNLSWVPEGHKPSYSEIIQSSTLARHAYTALFELTGRLAHRCGLGDNPAVNPVLPSLLVFLEWLTLTPKSLTAETAAGDHQIRARAFFWREISGLLNDVISGVSDGTPRVSGVNPGVSDVMQAGMRTEALWEDYELRGFEPLAGVQKSLDYSKPAPSFDTRNPVQTAQRRLRIVAAGKNLAASLADLRVEGLRFSEELGLFQYSREVSDRRPEDFTLLERGGFGSQAEVRRNPVGADTGLELGFAENMAGLEPGLGGVKAGVAKPNLQSLVPAKLHENLSGLGTKADVSGGFAPGLSEGLPEFEQAMEDAETEEDDPEFMSSSKEELEAAKKQLFQRAQQARSLKGSARDALAVDAEKVFRAQIAAKKAVKQGGMAGVKHNLGAKLTGVKQLGAHSEGAQLLGDQVKEGVKLPENGLDEDEEEIVFQPSRRTSSQTSPVMGSPMQSQSSRPDAENEGPVRPLTTTQSAPPNVGFLPRQGLPSTADPVVGSSAFSFNQWVPRGAKRLDAALPGGVPRADPLSKADPANAFPLGAMQHAKASADIEAVTTSLLGEIGDVSRNADLARTADMARIADVSETLSPEMQARGIEQLKQLYELQQQLQGHSFPGGSGYQGMYPPASLEGSRAVPGGSSYQGFQPPASVERSLSAQQQYYNLLLQQQKASANHGAPAHHAFGANPVANPWAGSAYPWNHTLQNSSLFGGVGFNAPGFVGNPSPDPGFGGNPVPNSGFGGNSVPSPGLGVSAQGPTLQEGRVVIPLPKPVASNEQGILAPSLFAAPPVPSHRTDPPSSQTFGTLTAIKSSLAPGGAISGAARNPPPGFGAIRPPPGFNQRPASPNGGLFPPETTPPADDYKWLDGYTHTKPQTLGGALVNSAEHFRGEYGIGDPGIWGRSASPVAEWGAGRNEDRAKGFELGLHGPSVHDPKNPFVP